MDCLKSIDVIETLFFEVGARTFNLSSSNGTIDLLPHVRLLLFAAFPSVTPCSSPSNFDMLLNGNCITLHVHRTKIVMINFREFLTKSNFSMSKNSMMSAHMARFMRRSWESESLVMPCTVGKSQRPRIIINMVVCSMRSVHRSAETIKTSALSWKETNAREFLVKNWCAKQTCTTEMQSPRDVTGLSLLKHLGIINVRSLVKSLET